MDSHKMTTAFDFSARRLEGEQQALSEFAGRALLIVNVASKCGFTPQYEGLEALWRRHRQAGLVVLGFPCDQFRHQEPGDAAQIAQFCALHYEVSFPMFDKVEVNGAAAHPLWQWLCAEKRGWLGSRAIKWNFTKFLLGRDGHVRSRYAPTTRPEALERDILEALG
jgi:glutathione peroxidase